MPAHPRKLCRLAPPALEALETRSLLAVTLLNGQMPTAEHIQLAEAAMSNDEYQAIMAEDADLGDWRFEFDDAASDEHMYDFANAVGAAHGEAPIESEPDASYEDWSFAADEPMAAAGDVGVGDKQSDFEGYDTGSETYGVVDEFVEEDERTEEIVTRAHTDVRPTTAGIQWVGTGVVSPISFLSPAANQITFSFQMKPKADPLGL